MIGFVASYYAGWASRDLAELEKRIVGALIVCARYLRQPLPWLLEQSRSWLVVLINETIAMMKRERNTPIGGG